MATESADPTDVFADFARWEACIQARGLEAMLDHRDREMERIALLGSPMRRVVERGAIVLSIAERAKLSEGQIQHRLSVGDTVRDQSPLTWQAFLDGRVDLGRVTEIAHTIDKLKRADSVHRLDAWVVGYAETHTPAELRAWLRRFVQRVEADLAVERAEDARKERRVSIRHGDDSMGDLSARLPSHELAAVEDLLRKTARRGVDPDDERTVAQREADVLVEWCLSGSAGDASTGSTSAIDANIAVTIGADVLAGARPGFAESTDERWAVPAAWIAAVTASGSAFWHRIITSPAGDDILAHEYIGRFAPDILNIALRFLHGTCQSPGCMVPAERCDTDHREPFPEGPTRGDNLGPLCRRHHSYKGHGLLHWTTRPTTTVRSARVQE